MRKLVVFALLSSLAAAVLVMPAGSAEPAWDFVVRYETLDSSVTFSMVGSIPYGMDCPAGWDKTEVVTLIVPSNVRVRTVFGSYSGVIKDQEDAGAERRTVTYTCDSPTPYDPPEGIPIYGTVPVTNTRGAVLAPFDHVDDNKYAARACVQAVFHPYAVTEAPRVPFTGFLGVSLSKRVGPTESPFSYSEAWSYQSNTWIAGVQFQMLPYYGGNSPDSGMQCNVNNAGSMDSRWKVDWTTSGVGHWRGELWSCDWTGC